LILIVKKNERAQTISATLLSQAEFIDKIHTSCVESIIRYEKSDCLLINKKRNV